MTAVWVGYPTERTLIVNGSRAFGGTVAAPIWAAFMKKALAGLPAREFPNADPPSYDTSKFHIPVTAAALKPDITVYVYSSRPKGTVLGKVRKQGQTTITISKGPAPGTGGGGGGGGTGTGGGGTGTGGGGGTPTGTPTP